MDASEGNRASSPRDSRSWAWLLSELERDGRLWVFLFASLCAFRVVFITQFRDRIGDSSDGAALVWTLLNGARYDAIAASYGVLLPLAGTLCAAVFGRRTIATRVRSVASVLWPGLVSVASVAALRYYAEYGETFDEHLFGLFLDDTRAVATTLWKSYQPLQQCALALAAGVVGTWLLRAWCRRETSLAHVVAERVSSAPARVALVAGLLLCLVVGLRGSWGRRPAQLKDAAVTADTLLNQAVLNPLVTLRYAVKQQLEMTGSAGLEVFLPNRDVEAAVRTLFGVTGHRPELNLDQSMQRTAPGPVHAPPRHVFVIVGEGLSAWPLLESHASLGIAHGLRRLAEEGIQVTRFLPASYGTIESLGAILTGLPDAQVHTNYREQSRHAYPSSPAPLFHRLGYRTRFFYGGFLSWQRVGDFARDQGFDEVYGGASMGAWADSNEWGVDDEYLFEFVRKTGDDSGPSFNVILTTSLHPPYDVDVRAHGFDEALLPPARKHLREGSTSDGFLRHYWYADRCIERFAVEAADRLRGTLIAVTGDHPSRVRLSTSNLFDQRAVPLILYGPEVLDGLRIDPGTSGSHIDIVPTLIELAAPRGFHYASVGRSLLSGEPGIGIGQRTVISPDSILDLRHTPIWERLGSVAPPPRELLEQWQGRHDAAHGFAWWRIMRGPRWTRPASRRSGAREEDHAALD